MNNKMKRKGSMVQNHSCNTHYGGPYKAVSRSRSWLSQREFINPKKSKTLEILEKCQNSKFFFFFTLVHAINQNTGLPK